VRTIRGCRLAVQPLPALHAEAVPPQVVMSARRTHEAARRIGLQPALVLAPVPDAVLRSEHPSSAFAVEHRQVAHGDAIRARLEISGASLLDQELVSDLCFREWIDRHAGSILAGIRDGLMFAFGSAWFVPVAAAIALSAYMLWPKARPRGVDVVAGAVAAVSLIGLFGLAGNAGGAVGSGIDASLTGL